MTEFESLEDAQLAVRDKANRAQAAVVVNEISGNFTLGYMNIENGSLKPEFQEHRFVQLASSKWIVEAGEISRANMSRT